MSMWQRKKIQTVPWPPLILYLESNDSPVKGILLCFCFGLIFNVLDAQIVVKEQPEVALIMEHFIKIGKEEPYFDGWRVKIISTTDRRQLEAVRRKFERMYPEINYVLGHESPYYSLTVGSFEDRIALEPDLNKYKKDFPSSIPFRDKIMKTELFDKPDASY